MVNLSKLVYAQPSVVFVAILLLSGCSSVVTKVDQLDTVHSANPKDCKVDILKSKDMISKPHETLGKIETHVQRNVSLEVELV